MEKQLRILKEFQEKYPTAHVGGSVGLFLHGVDLKRDTRNADLDITVKYKLPNEHNLGIDNSEPSSNPSDFDYQFRVHTSNSGYTKLDIRVSPEPSFEVIKYNGCDYNVSRLEDILFWKQKYADAGSTKHSDDLIVINGGARPERMVEADLSELPF